MESRAGGREGDLRLFAKDAYTDEEVSMKCLRCR
jgi:hypothetical protein